MMSQKATAHANTVYHLDGTIKEVFVDFVQVERITGSVLELYWLRVHNLSRRVGSAGLPTCLVLDQSVVQREAPLAMYFHCAAHL